MFFISDTATSCAMVIVTLADLHARDQETSSTPAQNHATPNPKQSQSRQVSSTAGLRRQLQALDKALSNIQPGHCNEADIANITEACKSYHDGRTYVNGSEELWLMLRKLWAPQFIPNIYTEAFMALLAGRYHVNNDKYDDSFSTVRDYLGRLDCACETDLEGKLARLEDQGTILHPSVAICRHFADSIQSNRFHFSTFPPNSAYTYTHTYYHPTACDLTRILSITAMVIEIHMNWLSCSSTSRCMTKQGSASMGSKTF